MSGVRRSSRILPMDQVNHTWERNELEMEDIDINSTHDGEEADDERSTLGDPDYTRLHEAAAKGNVDDIKDLIAAIGNVNISTKSGLTPLHEAAKGGILPIIQLLIAKGGETNSKKEDGWTPLHFAACYDHPEAARFLLQSKGIVGARTRIGSTPLHIAVAEGSTDTALVLIESKGDVNAINESGATPLHDAARDGQVETAQVLIKYNANVNARDRDKWTPLHFAANNGHDGTNTIKLLIDNGGDVNAKDQDGYTPLHFAAQLGDNDTVQVLIKRGSKVNETNDDKNTPLHLSVDSGHYDVTKTLIENGSKINALNTQHAPLHVASFEGFDDIVELLLEKGADMQIEDSMKWTPLHFASYTGKHECVSVLLERKGDQDCQDLNGSTPVHFAIRHKDTTTAKLLLAEKYGNHTVTEDTINLFRFVTSGKQAKIESIMSGNEESFKNVVFGNLGTLLNIALHFGQRDTAKKFMEDGFDVIPHGSTRHRNVLTNVFDNYSESMVRFAKAVQLEFWQEVEHDIGKLERALIKEAKSGESGSTEQSVANEDDQSDDRPEDDEEEDQSSIDQEQDKELTKQQLRQRMKTHHYRKLSHWYEALHNVRFERLLKVPEFICNELDASVKYRTICKNTTNDIHQSGNFIDPYKAAENRYYATFYSNMEDVSYRISYDMVNKFEEDDTEEDNHPLTAIVDKGSTMLLDHPVVRLLIRKKWSIALGMYLPFLIYFALYTVLFTVYIATSITEARNRTKFEIPGTFDLGVQCSETNLNYTVMAIFLFLMAIFGIITEMIQVCSKKASYFSVHNAEIVHNLMDWFSYCSGIVVVVLTFINGCIVYGDWVWAFGIIAVLVCCFNCILFMRIIPFLGIHVVMVEMIFISFLEFCVIFTLFLLSFAVCFHLIVPHEEGYTKIGYSIITTWVMMAGELNYAEIVESDDIESLDSNEWLIHVIFVVFLISLSLIIMNLLTGIAVSDVQKLREQSEYRVLKMQIEYSLTAEKVYNSVKSLFCGKARTGPESGTDATYPPIDKDFEIIPKSSRTRFNLLDHIFYGPLNKKYCMDELKKIVISKKQNFYVVLNIKWRKSIIQDTAKALENVKKENEEIKVQLSKLEEQNEKTHDVLGKILDRLEKDGIM